MKNDIIILQDIIDGNIKNWEYTLTQLFKWKTERQFQLSVLKMLYKLIHTS
jgi:hypothetical protein